MIKLFCMRHGQTNYNLLSLCNDDPTRDVHLTDEGRQQAERAAKRLAECELEKIYTSELPRTWQTGEIINRVHHCQMQAHPLLNDIRSGFESRAVTEYQQAIAQDPLHLRVNGGESILDHKLRILAFLNLLQSQPEQCVLLIGHEEGLRVLDAYNRRLDDNAMLKLHFSNCQILEFNL